jgi:hypothetical protein
MYNTPASPGKRSADFPPSSSVANRLRAAIIISDRPLSGGAQLPEEFSDAAFTARFLLNKDVLRFRVRPIHAHAGNLVVWPATA